MSASLGSTTYASVTWTAGDVITEAKLDNMVANDQAYDSHAAQGLLLNNAKSLGAKNQAGSGNLNLIKLNSSDKMVLGDGSDVGLAAEGIVVDEDDMASNSAEKLPTQQSVKAYVDSNAAFWNAMPATPTRTSDTAFTMPDVSNAGKLDLIFEKGVVLKWYESGTLQIAYVESSSYSSDVVTVNIIGNSLTAGFDSMTYCINMAMIEQFIIAGSLATGTGLAKAWYPVMDVLVIGADATVLSSGTTNATTFDINDDGSTLFTTKPSIASGATTDLGNVSDNPTTAVAKNSKVTIDIDAVSTTPPEEAYIYLFYIPKSWVYR